MNCTNESLIKQALGCFATAAAVAKGMFETEAQAVKFVCEVVTDKVKTLFNRTAKRVKELGIVRGITPSNSLDWHLEPRFACASSDSVVKEYHASMFDEEYQYQQFREYAVEGCPF